MTELLNKSQDGTSEYLHYGPGFQKNPRSRLGQARAAKRSIIDYKRGSGRVPKGQRKETVKSQNTSSLKQNSHEGDIDLSKMTSVSLARSPATDSPSSSPDSEPPSPTTPSANTTTEYKRPRPEVQITCNMETLSSSAPSACVNDNPNLLFDSGRSGLLRDNPRQFTCTPSFVDEQRLQYLLSRESQYHPNNAFLYYVNPDLEDKVDAVLRNEAVHNLRFMHNAFFNLSTETFCKAVNLIDRFIVKVKVKPKYMACVATASYCVASKLCHANKVANLPDLDSLVNITRCGGNAADLVRMEEILASKLSHDLDGVNAFDFLQLFTDSLICTTNQTGAFVNPSDATPNTAACDSNQNPFLPINPPGSDEQTGIVSDSSKSTKVDKAIGNRKITRSHIVKRLMTKLEIILCSLEAYRFRPACLALGIMAHLSIRGLVPLANMCGIDWADVLNCASLVEELYEIYYRDPLPCVRRPMGPSSLSKRALLRIGYSCPTPLDTITEDSEPAEEDEWLLPLLFEP